MCDFILLNRFKDTGNVAVRISDISSIIDVRSSYYNETFSKITLKNGISHDVKESTKDIFDLVRNKTTYGYSDSPIS